MVGVQEVELDGAGLPNRDVVLEQMERHGADLAFRLHMGGNMGCSAGFAGCAVVGGTLSRGYWRGEVVHQSVCRGTSTALCAAHELGHNLLSDIGPLVENRNIDREDWITLTGNPLSEESLNVHVPALRERGVQVGVDSVRLLVSPDSREAAFDISGYFSAALGPEAQTTVTSDGTGSIRAELVDGELRVDLADCHAPSTVTVTGTGTGDAVETLDFHVSLRQVVALFPPAASPAYQGFVPVINHSAQAGRVVIRATDDAARRYEPVTLAIGPGEAVHFNS